MGSKYLTITQSDMQQTRNFENSGVDISVAASASAFGNTAGSSVQSKQEQQQSSYYQSQTTTLSRVSLETPIPSGNTMDEIQQSWQDLTSSDQQRFGKCSTAYSIPCTCRVSTMSREKYSAKVPNN